MAEYIEREAVLAEADYDGNFNLVITAKKVRNIPAADVQPVVHGRWVDDSIESVWVRHKCSVCEFSKIMENRQVHDWNYCPNCGAKMRGGLNE